MGLLHPGYRSALSIPCRVRADDDLAILCGGLLWKAWITSRIKSEITHATGFRRPLFHVSYKEVIVSSTLARRPTLRPAETYILVPMWDARCPPVMRGPSSWRCRYARLASPSPPLTCPSCPSSNEVDALGGRRQTWRPSSTRQEVVAAARGSGQISRPRTRIIGEAGSSRRMLSLGSRTMTMTYGFGFETDGLPPPARAGFDGGILNGEFG